MLCDPPPAAAALFAAVCAALLGEGACMSVFCTAVRTRFRSRLRRELPAVPDGSAVGDICAETVQADVRPQPDAGVVASPVDMAEAAPAAGVDPLAADYNEYTDPSSPTFVTDAEKIIWWGKQSVVKKCMTDKGLAYDDARWWHGENSQPRGLRNGILFDLRISRTRDTSIVGWRLTSV